MKRADELVDRLVPMSDPLPRTAQTGRSRVDPRLSRLASRLIAKPVEIRCWNRTDWRTVVGSRNALAEETGELAGFVWAGRAHVEGVICDRLAVSPAVKGDLHVASALKVVAHEAKHLSSPEWTEAQVECWALQHIEHAARLVGGTASAGRRLALLEWRLAYPLNPPAYRSRDCRPGGAWDETPSDGVWP